MTARVTLLSVTSALIIHWGLFSPNAASSVSCKTCAKTCETKTRNSHVFFIFPWDEEINRRLSNPYITWWHCQRTLNSLGSLLYLSMHPHTAVAPCVSQSASVYGDMLVLCRCSQTVEKVGQVGLWDTHTAVLCFSGNTPRWCVSLHMQGVIKNSHTVRGVLSLNEDAVRNITDECI